MKLISENDINTAVAKMGAYGDNPIQSLISVMNGEQGDLLDYLVEVEADDFNRDERDLLLTVVVTAWFILKDAAGSMPPKSGAFIDYLLERNLDRYEEIGEEEEVTADGFFDELFAEGAEQPILMGFLSGLVLDRPESYAGEIRDEHVPAILLHVKTVVDALVLDEEEWSAEREVGEFSQEDFDEAAMIVIGLYEEYENSANFEKLGGRERANSRMIVTGFGEFMYNYFLLMPAAWTSQRAAEVCAELMPRKVLAPDDFFASLYPVLISFMGFVAEKGAVPHADRIARRLLASGGKP
ncbi:MAG TPA: hypothetical protein VLM75_05580 [Spirochaetota bacterium]|nr:hypothetical protein [Spirochaetota bacterium]